MFVTLLPNAPDLLLLAGVSPENNNTVIISVISTKLQSVLTNFSTFPKNFREAYCDECPNYRCQDLDEMFESTIARESYMDWGAYEAALTEAANEVNREDYESDWHYQNAVERAQNEIQEEDFIDEDRYQEDCDEEYNDWYDEFSCEGGADIVLDDCCRHYRVEDVTKEGTTWHTTVPHVYQYRVTYQPWASPEWEIKDRLFAIDDNTEQTEETIQVKVAPYEVGNVFDTGSVCWGENYLSENMRHQYALFWNSTFNNDLVPSDHDIEDWLTDFYLYFGELNWKLVEASTFFGCEGISNDSETERPIEGILIIPQQEDNLNPYLTWVYKDEKGYYAYTVKDDPDSRINLESDQWSFCN